MFAYICYKQSHKIYTICEFCKKSLLQKEPLKSTIRVVTNPKGMEGHVLLAQPALYLFIEVKGARVYARQHRRQLLQMQCVGRATFSNNLTFAVSTLEISNKSNFHRDNVYFLFVGHIN